MRIFILLTLTGFGFRADPPTAKEIIEKVEFNMTSDTRIVESEMVIYGKRKSRTISSRGYSRGKYDNFTEYLAPEREKGTKMLKLKNYLWIYSPSSDRTIQLSGHMLRQSLMGSDLSYEDMMEDRNLIDLYDAVLSGEEEVDGRKVWVLTLTAKVDDATYQSRKMWIDQERYVPLKEELFAKSGQLLKRMVMSDVQQIDRRWYPMKVNYKDMLKESKGTDFRVTKIEINPVIPDHIFTKSSLKK
ncbi:outer membrane lipoprotein-sorting protein [Fulvivirga sp. M361]|uniref:outer membrane lipoprotein-sorting protein n=1 Tax=Fulvivirga sp. M361 TaxID=2594266 RepID=UPI00117A3358|nr:outer membrane lipoprotein-sorting protein [Fulvivirga sp. M361]TRX51192.1 outer membrane lipoprotein-sorting protein [Fulvivirga sp. M361]